MNGLREALTEKQMRIKLLFAACLPVFVKHASCPEA
jgi:hypothetical protein